MTIDRTSSPVGRRWRRALVGIGALALGACGSDRAAAPSSSAAPTSTIDVTTTSTQPTTSTEPTTATTTTTTDVAEGFNPPCVESTNDRPPFQFANEVALDTFGPLATEPALRVTLPLGRSTDVPELQAPGVSVERIPGGALLAVVASSYGHFEGGVLAAVDADGENRWVRCFADRIDGMFVAPAASAPTTALIAFAISQDNAVPVSGWRFVSLDDGAVVGELSDLFAAQGVDPTFPISVFPLVTSPDSVVFGPSGDTVVDPTRDHLILLDLHTSTVEVLPFPEQSAGGELFRQRFQFADSGDLVLMGDGLVEPANAVVSAYRGGRWTQAPAVLRRTYGTRVDFGSEGRGLIGFDALGQQLWRDDNVSDSRLEGFRLAASGPVTVISGCFSSPAPDECADRGLAGVETATGTILWQLPEMRQVAAVGDGFALISQAIAAAYGDGKQGPWMLIDTSTGELVDSTQQWLEPDTFRQECCGGGEFVWVGHDGGVVIAVNGEHVALWYPKAQGLTAREITIP